MFLINFYIMVTGFVLLNLKISYWSFIFCDFQRPSSTKPWLLTAAFVFQNVENDENFENIIKNIKKSLYISKFQIEYISMKENKCGM